MDGIGPSMEQALRVTAPTEDEIEDWHAFYVFFKRLHQGWHDDALDHAREPFRRASDLPPSQSPASPTAQNGHAETPSWRRGDYFFCEGCGQRKQWWKNSPPWQGAICATCYNAELARIEAARGRKA